MATKFYEDADTGAVLVKAFCHKSKFEQFDLLEPKTEGVGAEKHVPVVQVEDGVVTVTVGEVEHPMTDEHFITFVCLQSRKGDQIFRLAPGAAPRATFALTPDDEPLAVFIHCNKHGMWKTSL